MSDWDDSLCSDCGGRCCSFKRGLNISYRTIPKGERYDNFIDRAITDQLLRQDGSIPDMRWWIARRGPDMRRELVFDCRHVTKNGYCRVHKNKPDMCKSYKCAALEGDVTLGEFLLEHATKKEYNLEREVTREVNEKLEDIKDGS